MKKILMAVVAAMTVAIAGGDITPVQETVVSTPKAFTGFYVGGGLTLPTTYVDGEKKYFSDDENSEFGEGLGLNAGYVFYNTGAFSVAVEGRAARGIWNETDIDYTYNYGLYVKPEAYLFDKTIGFYGLAGYARAGIETDVDYHKDGFAYGVGGEYFFTDKVSAFVDYTMLPDFKVDVDGESINNDQFMIGVNYRF